MLGDSGNFKMTQGPIANPQAYAILSYSKLSLSSDGSHVSYISTASDGSMTIMPNSTSNSRSLVLNPSGYLGIGMAPIYPLDMLGVTRINVGSGGGSITFSNSGDDAVWLQFRNNAGTGIPTLVNLCYWGGGNLTRVDIRTNVLSVPGSIGIGNSSPGVPLDVTGDIRTTTNVTTQGIYTRNIYSNGGDNLIHCNNWIYFDQCWSHAYNNYSTVAEVIDGLYGRRKNLREGVPPNTESQPGAWNIVVREDGVHIIGNIDGNDAGEAIIPWSQIHANARTRVN